MRQAGVLAACGIVSPEVMNKRLHQGHENARYLGEQRNTLDGVSANMDQIRIDMVFRKAAQPNFSSNDFVAFMLERGVKVYGILADVAKERNLFLIGDEVYREFVYGGERLTSIGEFPDIAENAIDIDFVSKRFSACGVARSIKSSGKFAAWCAPSRRVRFT